MTIKATKTISDFENMLMGAEKRRQIQNWCVEIWKFLAGQHFLNNLDKKNLPGPEPQKNIVWL